MRPVSLPDSSHVNRFEHILLTALAASLTMACLSAQAEMQIPNPLIRPRGIGSQAAAGPPREPGASAQLQTAPRTPASAPASYAGAVPLPGTVLPSDDPFDRTLTELTNRFANFYVSAIVGKQAMLRRSAAALATPAATGPGAMAAVPLTGAAPVASSRSESMTLTNGELLPFVSKAGALMVKVSDGIVTITYVQETMSLPGGRLMGRRAIIFAGGVDSSGTTVAAAIVLEKTDPAYKRMITVETKTRGASANGNGSTETPGTTPPSPNAGLPLP
ncbi:MAG: hypothetical protein H7327_12745 [Herminiimonas sp.]|nr:hypothetical protein [Herminiimonas sp.]